MKLLSEASEYALRAVVWCAQYPNRTFKVREIAEHTQSAPGYLAKVLQSLAKAEILLTQRGSHGGFRLNRDSAELTAFDVIQAIDPIERLPGCPLGSAKHQNQLCPLHQRIDDATATVEQAFRDTTIADLIKHADEAASSCDALTAEQGEGVSGHKP